MKKFKWFKPFKSARRESLEESVFFFHRGIVSHASFESLVDGVVLGFMSIQNLIDEG
jgi:hypothetical protein